MNKKDIIFPAMTLAIICAVCTLLLSLTNFLTFETVALRKSEAEKAAMAIVLPAEEYEKGTCSFNDNEFEYFTAFDKDKGILGYLFLTDSYGYGSNISVMTAFSPKGEIVNIQIVSCDGETPGLGQRIKEPSFTDQYSGKSPKLVVVKESAANKEIDAVTGATISSSAVVNAVNLAHDLFATIER